MFHQKHRGLDAGGRYVAHQLHRSLGAQDQRGKIGSEGTIDRSLIYIYYLILVLHSFNKNIFD